MKSKNKRISRKAAETGVFYVKGLEQIGTTVKEERTAVKEGACALRTAADSDEGKKLPVLVLLEGWGAAGKGSVLGKIIKNIDPRFFKVAVMDEPTAEEQRKPFLYRHFVKIPEAGKFVFMDSGWMKRSDKGKAARGIIRAGV